MRRLLALIFVITLWFSFAPAASADVGGLVPCKDSPAFQQRAKNARPTTDDPDNIKNRFERYSQALCGPEGLPHLVVDGRLDRAGDFLIPSVLFLYIAGWIGWVGRAYLQSIKKDKSPEEKEIIIDVPKAVPIMVSGVAWPLMALKEIATGEIAADDAEIPVSPR